MGPSSHRNQPPPKFPTSYDPAAGTIGLTSSNPADYVVHLDEQDWARSVSSMSEAILEVEHGIVDQLECSASEVDEAHHVYRQRRHFPGVSAEAAETAEAAGDRCRVPAAAMSTGSTMASARHRQQLAAAGKAAREHNRKMSEGGSVMLTAGALDCAEDCRQLSVKAKTELELECSMAAMAVPVAVTPITATAVQGDGDATGATVTHDHTRPRDMHRSTVWLDCIAGGAAVSSTVAGEDLRSANPLWAHTEKASQAGGGGGGGDGSVV